MKVIENSLALEELCNSLRNNQYIIIDTEFMRSKTYFSVLCVVQIADEHGEYVIDCLAEDLDLTPLNDILFNPNITKIFHDCKQDIEVILRKFGEIIYPIFDTQIAANLCGLGKTESLVNLANKFLGISLDKTMRYSDWMQRPLSNDQIEYALSDVIYLRDIYYHIKDLMDSGDKHQKYQLMNESLAKVSNKENYDNNPEDAWLRLKKLKKKPKDLPLIKELAKWREINAKKYDMPRRHFLSDCSLMDLARTAPTSIKGLKQIKEIGDHIFDNELEQELLLIISKV